LALVLAADVVYLDTSAVLRAPSRGDLFRSPALQFLAQRQSTAPILEALQRAGALDSALALAAGLPGHIVPAAFLLTEARSAAKSAAKTLTGPPAAEPLAERLGGNRSDRISSLPPDVRIHRPPERGFWHGPAPEK
jgi:enoyl-CoA hydratase/carnithine racemase